MLQLRPWWLCSDEAAHPVKNSDGQLPGRRHLRWLCWNGMRRSSGETCVDCFRIRSALAGASDPWADGAAGPSTLKPPHRPREHVFFSLSLSLSPTHIATIQLLGTPNTPCRCHALRPAPLVLGSVHARSLDSPLCCRRPRHCVHPSPTLFLDAETPDFQLTKSLLASAQSLLSPPHLPFCCPTGKSATTPCVPSRTPLRP